MVLVCLPLFSRINNPRIQPVVMNINYQILPCKRHRKMVIAKCITNKKYSVTFVLIVSTIVSVKMEYCILADANSISVTGAFHGEKYKSV